MADVPPRLLRLLLRLSDSSCKDTIKSILNKSSSRESNQTLGNRLKYNNFCNMTKATISGEDREEVVLVTKCRNIMF